MREKKSIQQWLQGLEERGMLKVDQQEKSLLIDNILLSTTYWIPFADVIDRQGLEHGTAPVKSIARVLQMLIPYLEEPGRSQIKSLVGEYLSSSQKKPAGSRLGKGNQENLVPG